MVNSANTSNDTDDDITQHGNTIPLSDKSSTLAETDKRIFSIY